MEDQIKQALKNIKLNEETISMFLGALVVVVVGVVAFVYFNRVNQGQITDQAAIEEMVSDDNDGGDVVMVDEGGVKVPQGLPTTYKVEAGDNLWKIAEKYYNSGYNWVDIASENNLSNANVLTVGQELNIPKVGAKEATVVDEKVTVAATDDTIEGSEYTVQKADSLWKIAVRSYGDGYAWTRIYDANKETVGSNPGVIEEGMVLAIPR